MAKTKLNIFLGKAGVSLEDIIRHLNPEPNCIDLPKGKFYYKEVIDRKPKWITDFFIDTVDQDGLRNKTIQAVFITEVEVEPNEIRVFAITFGLGRNLIKLESFEERFGIITAMNLIDESRIRSIDCNSLENNPKTSRVQLGRSSGLNDFDLDNEYDILKNISGRMGQDSFEDAKTASGRQSLSISITTDVNNIGNTLKSLYDIYKSEDYRQKFPGVDHTREVKDRTEIERLDSFLILALTEDRNNPDRIVSLSLPEIIEERDVQHFNYARSRHPYQDVDLEDMISELESNYPEIDLNLLKREHLSAVGLNGERIGYWKLYRCLVADIRMENHQYVLNEGKWYAYDDDYAAEVLRYYNEADISNIQIPDCGIDMAEKDYNTVAADSFQDAVKWDCSLINPFKETTFEVCDIYDKTTDSFIHVKKNTGSSALSHLFLQGSVSGDLMTAKKVRHELLVRKPEMNPNVLESNYDASRYSIVYGIIEKGNDNDDRPSIPFFSKVSFRQVSRVLRNIGYSVKLKSIKWR